MYTIIPLALTHMPGRIIYTIIPLALTHMPGRIIYTMIPLLHTCPGEHVHNDTVTSHMPG